MTSSARELGEAQALMWCVLIAICESMNMLRVTMIHIIVGSKTRL